MTYALRCWTGPAFVRQIAVDMHGMYVGVELDGYVHT